MHQLAEHIKSLLSISDQSILTISDHVVEKHFSKKEHLLRTGDQAKEVYFILEGCVRTYVFDVHGVEHTITFSTENWWFGDLQSYLNKTAASFNIQALENTMVLSMSRDSWDYLISKVPEFVAYTRILFQNTLFAHENRILQNLSYTAQQRYQHFLRNHPDLSQRVSQKHIASYLGITPEFLSVLRKKRDL